MAKNEYKIEEILKKIRGRTLQRFLFSLLLWHKSEMVELELVGD